MSEEITEESVVYNSFQREVWQVLSNIDVGPHIEKGAGGRQNLTYLPWASAWGLLMEHYPESHFEFDPLHYYENRTAEVWVTVTVIDGAKSMSRRWWLPVFAQTKQGPQAVTDPTSTQVNNCRMRALVKCLACMGLGIEIYGHEGASDDVPTGAVEGGGTSGKITPMGAVMDDVNLTDAQWSIVNELAGKAKIAAPTADTIDPDAITALYYALREQVREHGADIHVAASSKMSSFVRSALKKVGKAVVKAEQEETLGKLQGDADE